MEPERRRVAGRQQRAAAVPDVEPHRGGDQVGDAPLGARHHVQRPHAPLHGHGHQHLARRHRPPAGPCPRDTSRSSSVAAAARAGSPEAPVPDAGEQVRVRPGPLPQQIVALMLLLLGRAEAVERRRPLRQRRQYPRVPLPRPGLLIHQRRKRRHRSFFLPRPERRGIRIQKRSASTEQAAGGWMICGCSKRSCASGHLLLPSSAALQGQEDEGGLGPELIHIHTDTSKI